MSLVNDDNVNTFYHSNGQNEEDSIWVKVHFDTTPVSKIVLVNRLGGSDICSDTATMTLCLIRLKNTLISLWKDGSKVKNCGTIENIETRWNDERNQTYVEYCGGDVGNMVVVSQAGEYLHFAEIRIYKELRECLDF